MLPMQSRKYKKRFQKNIKSIYHQRKSALNRKKEATTIGIIGINLLGQL
jgi:hypothetical protein